MLKPQDLDQLSLYLDHQLPAAERAAFEARLAAEPELRAALAELRLTVQALRALPTLRPPRSFTLTPAQAGTSTRRAGFGAFGALRLATALTAVVLVVTVAGDFASTRLAPGATATNLASAPAAATVVAQAEAPAAAITSEAERSAGEDASEPAGGGAAGAAEAQAATPEPLPMATAAPLGTPAPPAMAPPPTATPEVAALGAPAPTEATPAGDVVRTMEATAEPSPKGAPTEPTMLGAPPAEGDAGEAGEADATGAQDEFAAAPALPPIRVVELALAGLTVLLGLSAWLARRAR